jgi:hypothetical protein
LRNFAGDAEWCKNGEIDLRGAKYPTLSMTGITLPQEPAAPFSKGAKACFIGFLTVPSGNWWPERKGKTKQQPVETPWNLFHPFPRKQTPASASGVSW